MIGLEKAAALCYTAVLQLLRLTLLLLQRLQHWRPLRHQLLLLQRHLHPRYLWPSRLLLLLHPLCVLELRSL